MFDDIANFAALLAACQRAAQGKRRVLGAAAFLASKERHLLHIADALQQGTWRPGPYKVLHVTEPKVRTVSAAPFADRVVHQALCAQIQPVFERGFISDSYANRVGYGTHRAVARYEHYRDRFPYVLRADIYRYFPAIDHAVLKADLRRRLKCPRTLALCDTIIEGSNAQEPVNLFYPGDDLFTPHARRRGLPIGNLTSQLFGNVYLNPLDHFVKEVLRVPGYVRYVDDFALFGKDPAQLQDWRERVEVFLAKRRLSLHPRKTALEPCALPALFLGYVLHPGWRTLPPDNVKRFRDRLNNLRQRWQAGTVEMAEVQNRISAWAAHAQHAQTHGLQTDLFRGKRFDPAKRAARAQVLAMARTLHR
jgi:RNA-directed DNA polymerase